MSHLKKKMVAMVVCVLLVGTSVMLLANQSTADWAEGDGHKMHFPQLPNPDGWDVNATWPLNVLADDWNCSESGPVTDIHFWGSWRYDAVGTIEGFHISIWSNNPGDPNAGIPSYPEEMLWSDYITDFKAISAGTGTQSWYEPEPDILYQGDHEMYYQYNIINISEPFWQEMGTIYWLAISANVSSPGTWWGWKTSIYTNTYDDAYWGWYDPTMGYMWSHELYIDPPSVSMDLAFVITGTPCCNKDWNYWSGWPNIWLISGGNVGIGTSTPVAKLDVHGDVKVTTGASGVQIFNTNTGTSACTNLFVTDVGRPALRLTGSEAPNAGDFCQWVMRTDDGTMRFNARDVSAGVWKQAMTFDYINERIGINTNSPDEKFEIEWTATVDMEIGRGTSDPDITFITLRSADGTKWYVYPDNTGTLTTTTVHP